MSETLIIAIIQFATKFGLDAAIAFSNAVNKPNVTIDDAIAALKDIQAKSAADYLKAAGVASQPQTPAPPSSSP